MKYLQILNFSKFKREDNFSTSTPKRRFIYYNSFSLQLIESLYEQKKKYSKCDLHVLFIEFFSKMCNKKHLFSPDRPHNPENRPMTVGCLELDEWLIGLPIYRRVYFKVNVE